MPKLTTLKCCVIARWHGGYVLQAAFDGQTCYCGADRCWQFDLETIRAPFPTFRGAEWYFSEWRV